MRCIINYITHQQPLEGSVSTSTLTATFSLSLFAGTPRFEIFFSRLLININNYFTPTLFFAPMAPTTTLAPPSTPMQMHPSRADTSILLDSPALNSLKRAQLVQLCKRHGVKASGKNAVLVGRLRRVAGGGGATPAPAPTPLRLGGGGDCGEDEEAEEEGDRTLQPPQQRPSETWEIVVDEDDLVEEQYPGSVQSKTRLGPSGSGSGFGSGSGLNTNQNQNQNMGLVNEFGSTGSSKCVLLFFLCSSSFFSLCFFSLLWLLSLTWTSIYLIFL